MRKAHRPKTSENAANSSYVHILLGLIFKSGATTKQERRSQGPNDTEQAYRSTGGRALFACGSPYDPVKLGGRAFVPRQGNNSYIFPGVGLGAIASGAQRITDEMFMSAARALANLVSEEDLAQGSLYPALPRIREVSARIAAEVARLAYARGLAPGRAPDNLLAHVQSQMYEPSYCS